jgi:hypothetical protein
MERKKEKNQIRSLLFSLQREAYYDSLMIRIFFPLKSHESGPFLSWVILYISQNHIFHVEVLQNIALKKSLFPRSISGVSFMILSLVLWIPKQMCWGAGNTTFWVHFVHVLYMSNFVNFNSVWHLSTHHQP